MPIYIGVNGKARKIKGGYIGNGQGKAIPIYTNEKLPEGYYPVRYIYSDTDSSRYYDAKIDLNITINKQSRIICVFSSALNASTSSESETYILSQEASGGSGYFYLSSQNNNRLIKGMFGVFSNEFTHTYIPDGVTNNADVPISKRYVLDINRDTSLGTYLRYGTGSYDLFFNNNSSSFSNFSLILNYTNAQFSGAGVKYYYLEIYNNIWTNSKPTAQLYPCLKNVSGTMQPGLYDVVRNTFYTNSSFKNGPSVQQYDISL